MSTKVWTDKKGTALRLRWNHDGRRYQLSLGVKDDNAGNAYAQMIAGKITRDIECENFDKTLDRYQNTQKRRPKGKVTRYSRLTAVELFEQYIAHYQAEKNVSHGSVLKLQAIASKLTQFLSTKPADKVTDAAARDIIARWSETTSTQTLKAYLYYLKACWDWAEGKYQVTSSNPWSECLDRARSRGRNNPQPKQKKPFTIAELQAIIAAFKVHPQYSHYTEFVIFLAHSACRFGEAAGLRWGSLGADFSTAWIGESISRGHQNKKGTKTGKTRTIHLPPTLQAMLVDRFDRIQPQPNDLVFPSPKGLAIDDHRFRARAWKTILESCHIEWRTPYNLRHSAISHALDRGANYIALAEQTGHDKRVMLSTYAHAIEQKCLFVDFGGK
jgi:integrase